tara:strand:+ start:126 stop:359 length:234 start_codon:yes stop_codon:yes gene_type:complete
MKEITQKQIIEWQAELDVQKQKKLQAEQVLDETNRTILMIEGGIQFAQIALKKHESVDLQSNTVDLRTKSEKAQSKS